MASDACRCLMAAGICQINALKQSKVDGLAERFVLIKAAFLIPIKIGKHFILNSM